jgi:hypothetical protein
MNYPTYLRFLFFIKFKYQFSKKTTMTTRSYSYLAISKDKTIRPEESEGYTFRGTLKIGGRPFLFYDKGDRETDIAKELREELHERQDTKGKIITRAHEWEE